jgi:hypothetical protein
MSHDQGIQAIGFITVCQQESGAFGGYLLVNRGGRPLEFHCTTPVRPNRAQKILYGPTLQPYIYGELIGKALVAKSRLRPSWIVTDLPPVLAVREGLNCPAICLVESTADDLLVGESETLGPFQVVASVRHVDDLAVMKRMWELEPVEFDLWEPFERIRNAIQETQRARAARAA